MSKPRLGDWIQTYSGQVFYPLDPRPEEIHIIDIARSLSFQCRFSGHTRYFYSVAEHSVRVSLACPTDKAWALLHDASEAYLVDLPRPLKRFSELGRLYMEAEVRVMQAVCRRFGLPIEQPAIIEKIDRVLLITEKRDLMTMEPKPWEDTEIPLPAKITPWTSYQAETAFLARFKELGLRELSEGAREELLAVADSREKPQHKSSEGKL